MSSRLYCLYLFCTLLAFSPLAADAMAATIYVDSLTDDGSGCTLRDAVVSANTNAAVEGCIAGQPLPTVDLIQFSVTGTIQLSDAILVTEDLTIYGPTRYPDGPESANPVIVKAAQGTRAVVFDSLGDNAHFNLYYLTIAGPDSGEGGGISLSVGDSLYIATCILKACRAGAGGAIDNVGGASLFIDSSILAGNSATIAYGGAVYSDAPLRMDNCTVSGNYSAGEGGGVYGTSDVQLNENTFSGNKAAGKGGAVSLTGATASKVIRNSILWGDDALTDAEIANAGSPVTVKYSDVAGGDPLTPDPADPWPGEGNILASPSFILGQPAGLAPTAAGNYHLRNTSPCINAGTYPSGNGLDIDADIRYQDAGCDIGSDEAGPPFNDSFEYGTAIPAPWRSANLTVYDRRITRIRHLGTSSFRMLGSPASKSLRQRIPITGARYYDITLSGWSKASNASATGGPYRLEAVVLYNNGTTGRLLVPFSRTTHDWEYRFNVLTARRAFHGIIIYLRYANQTGTAWFDDIKVSVTPPPPTP